jgi:tetratricopeptide (TPR) repeat protein
LAFSIRQRLNLAEGMGRSVAGANTGKPPGSRLGSAFRALFTLAKRRGPRTAAGATSVFPQRVGASHSLTPEPVVFPPAARASVGRRAALAVYGLVAAASWATSGCASLRMAKVIPDSVTDCRKLSQQGVAALERGDAAQACQLLTEAVAKNPGDFDAHRQLAEALWRDGNMELAAHHIDEAVRLDARHAPTVVRSGEMRLAMGDVDAALTRADQAVAIDSTLGEAWALRAAARRQRGEFNAALSDLHQALRFQPHAAPMLMAEAELQFQLGRPQRCLTTLHHLLDFYPPGEEPQRALWLEGLAYEAVDCPHEAAESLWAAARRGPASADLLFQVAKARRAAGQEEAARDAAQQALAADAGHAGSRELLAALEARKANPQNRLLR